MIIKVGFSRPKSWFKPFSWAIRLFESTPYSHVYLSWTTNIGVEVVYQASHSMVNFMSKVNFDKQANTIEVFETEVEDDKYRPLIKFCLENAGTDYGILQALGIGLKSLFCLRKNPFDDGRKTQVCSELVGHIIKDYLSIDEVQDLDSAGPKMINDLCRRHFKQITPPQL